MNLFTIAIVLLTTIQCMSSHIGQQKDPRLLELSQHEYFEWKQLQDSLVKISQSERTVLNTDSFLTVMEFQFDSVGCELYKFSPTMSNKVSKFCLRSSKVECKDMDLCCILTSDKLTAITRRKQIFVEKVNSGKNSFYFLKIKTNLQMVENDIYDLVDATYFFVIK